MFSCSINTLWLRQGIQRTSGFCSGFLAWAIFVNWNNIYIYYISAIVFQSFSSFYVCLYKIIILCNGFSIIIANLLLIITRFESINQYSCLVIVFWVAVIIITDIIQFTLYSYKVSIIYISSTNYLMYYYTSAYYIYYVVAINSNKWFCSRVDDICQ